MTLNSNPYGELFSTRIHSSLFISDIDWTHYDHEENFNFKLSPHEKCKRHFKWLLNESCFTKGRKRLRFSRAH